MRICILGSGLSALTLAKALVNENICVDIVFSKKKFNINKSRTIGISKSNVEYFNKNIKNIEKIIWKLKKIEIFSDNLKNEKLLNFTNNNDQLFSIIKNFKLFEILYKSLSHNKYCKKITFTKKKIDFSSYNLIINTDYSNFLSKKIFNKKIVKIYNSLAYSTIIKHEKITNDTAIQIFTKNGPLAFLPISNNETSIVYSIHSSKDQNKDDVNKLIQEYNPKYKLKKIEKSEFLELKSFHLRSYHNGNILAFGDLLHRLHPLAGQGFNMTIRDIKILIDIIKEKIELGLPLDSSVNFEFEKKLKHKNYIFSTSIDFIYEFFNLERKFKNNFLSKFVQILGNNNSLNKFFKKIADRGIIF